MKLGSRIWCAAAALGLAAGGSASSQVVAGQNQNLAVAEQPADFVWTDDGEERYEATLSGRGFTSRDAIEGELLARTARAALASGADWFILLPMPGERSGEHPARSAPSYGAAYVHWQPHWTYFQRGEGWQPWHPEWAAPFWAEVVAPAEVQAWQVHAMVRLGSGEIPERILTFDTRRTASDLAAFAR
jgi:hypothetical protein